MTIRSMYAEQDEVEERSHCRAIGGADHVRTVLQRHAAQLAALRQVEQRRTVRQSRLVDLHPGRQALAVSQACQTP
jgi:hypothetical protein